MRLALSIPSDEIGVDGSKHLQGVENKDSCTAQHHYGEPIHTAQGRESDTLPLYISH